jgi:hypothetical protein
MQIMDNWCIPINVSAGVAEHFIKARYLGGTDYYGKSVNSYSQTITTDKLGLALPINIAGQWNILAEAQQYFP